MAEKTVIEAVRGACGKRAARSHRLRHGEDVGQAAAFPVTQGFIEEFGANRVIDRRWPKPPSGIAWERLRGRPIPETSSPTCLAQREPAHGERPGPATAPTGAAGADGVRYHTARPPEAACSTPERGGPFLHNPGVEVVHPILPTTPGLLKSAIGTTTRCIPGAQETYRLVRARCPRRSTFCPSVPRM